jgi:hypothetical protein
MTLNKNQVFEQLPCSFRGLKIRLLSMKVQHGKYSYFPTPYSPPSPRLICVETNPGPKMKRNRKPRSDVTMSNGEQFRRVLNQGFSKKFGLVDRVVRKMTANQQLTSNSSGIIQGVFSNNAAGYTNWTQMSGIYDEFRCIGGRMTLTCAIPNSTSALCTTAVVAFDNNDVSANLSSVTNGLDYVQCIKFPSVWDNDKEVSLTAVVSPTANNGNWAATTNSIPYPAGFKVYCANLTASQVYWNVSTEYIYEFRGSQ